MDVGEVNDQKPRGNQSKSGTGRIDGTDLLSTKDNTYREPIFVLRNSA